MLATDLAGLIDALSWAIADSGHTQKALAEASGLSAKHVNQMMTGRVVGSLASWQRLADAAGITVSVRVATRVIPPEET